MNHSFSICPLPFYPDVLDLVKIVGLNPPSFFLDSSDRLHPQAHFSYVGLDPSYEISSEANPWPLLQEWESQTNPMAASPPWFSGGLVGYLAYECHRFVEKAKWGTLARPGPRVSDPIPHYWFGFFEAVLVLDHQRQKAFFSSPFLGKKELKGKTQDFLDRSQKIRSVEENHPPSVIVFPWPQDSYVKKVQQIKNYLASGDVYQVNLTGRFETESREPAWKIYSRLREISPAPYAGFLNTGDFQILSASPESFLEIEEREIRTRPIKGTLARNFPPERLLHSPKDRAELLMIVDLERNDLGKVCEPGTIKVDPLYAVESFAQVHHLVSCVSGTLKKGITKIGALQALFPGGSVTGAPKIRAMEIIDELEGPPRSVYTGALGYLGGQAHFAMPIRTLTKVGEKIYFHAGGGIVADSDPMAEYEEMRIKAEGMIKALR